MAELNLGQINLQRSRAATEEVGVVGVSRRLDILLVQEQYAACGRVLQADTESMAGVMVLSDRYACTFIPDLSDRFRAVVHVDALGGIYLISAYFKYSDPIEPHILGLERTLTRLGDKTVLLGIDSNVSSPMWHARRLVRGVGAVRKRQLLEDFIAAAGLDVCNVAGQPPTFAGPMGESHIDVTLLRGPVEVRGWRVDIGASVSDHRLITYDVTADLTGQQTLETEHADLRRFNSKDVDWGKFRGMIFDRIGYVTDARTGNQMASRLASVTSQCCEFTLGRRTVTDKNCVPWWGEHLEALRNTLGTARRKYYRRRGSAPEHVVYLLRERYRSAKREFKCRVKEARGQYVRDIASGQGNSDPWGMAYSKKIKQ